MIEIDHVMPGNVLAVSAKGKITADDYTKVFNPALEMKLKGQEKVRLLYHLGEAFSGYSMSALMEDAKMGIKHLTDYEKVAIVTNVEWVSYAAKFFGAFLTCPVKVFANGQMQEAKEWVAE